MNRSRLIEALTRPEGLGGLSSREWEELIGYARATQLLARLALHAECRGYLDGIPSGPRRHLEAGRRLWEAQKRSLCWDIDSIGRALAHVDTPIVLLKGAAYLMAGLPVAVGRTFGDIDIMVRRDCLGPAEAALVAVGWHMPDPNSYDQQYYRQWMHELPPMQHVLRRTVLDIHHTITPPTSRYAVTVEKLFAAARPLAIPGNFFVLAPPDMLLHSITHLMQEGEFEHGLRDLIDIDDLFRHFGRDPAFWPALLQRAAEHRLGGPLYYAVTQVRRLLETAMPKEFLAGVAQMAPPRTARSVMNTIFQAGIVAEPPGGRHVMPGLCRWLLYVRGHYLRMPLRLLVPHLLRKAWRRAVAT